MPVPCGGRRHGRTYRFAVYSGLGVPVKGGATICCTFRHPSGSFPPVDWGLVTSLVSVAVAACAAWIAYTRRPAALAESLRRSLDAFRTDFGKLREELQDQVDTIRRDQKRVLDDAEDMLDRARTERARADGRRGGRGNKAQPDQPEITTREQYLRHLEQGGRPVPELESRLGI